MINELKKLKFLVARNIKIYFKDKLTFFVSLITPLILVFLFLAFLRGVYEDSLIAVLQGLELSKSTINAFTGGWLFSSILATSCITVAFCSGMMVYDKINNVKNDFQVAPIKKSTLQISYVIANFVTTMIVCLVLLGVSLIYLAIVGWYLSALNILMILLNMILTTLFGCLLANCIWTFVGSQGALSGVCTLVSSMYGFICGAYMPLSSMGAGIQGFASFLPGTYSTVLFRNFYMEGVISEIGSKIPPRALEELKNGFDCNFSFFGTNVSVLGMFLIVLLSVVVLLGLFVLLSKIKINSKQKPQKRIKNTEK